MKFGKVRGFSLTEMMIVMLMIAVVLAASAPMVTRKLSRDRSSDKVFYMLPGDEKNAVEYIKGRKQRIYMNGRADGFVGIIEAGSVPDPKPKNSILFGNNTVDRGADNLVGIGFSTTNAKNSVAIGYGAKSQGENSIAIGYGAEVKSGKKNTVAIGYNAKSEWDNNIVLGTDKDTVYIPGNLIVDKISILGGKPDGFPIMREFFEVTKNSGQDAYFYGKNFKRLLFPAYSHTAFSVYRRKNDEELSRNDYSFSPYTGSGFLSGEILNARGMVFGLVGNKNIEFAGHSITNYGGEGSTWGGVPEEMRGRANYFTYYLDSDKQPITSDIRLKDVGEAYVGGLDAISQLNPYHFTFKNDEDKTPHVGVMAQDLQKVFPDSVTADSEGWLRIRWDEMFYAAINAIKELNTKISDVIADITNIKAVIEEQQNINNSQTETIIQLQEQVKMQADIIAQMQKRLEKFEEVK